VGLKSLKSLNLTNVYPNNNNNNNNKKNNNKVKSKPLELRSRVKSNSSNETPNVMTVGVEKYGQSVKQCNESNFEGNICLKNCPLNVIFCHCTITRQLIVNKYRLTTPEKEKKFRKCINIKILYFLVIFIIIAFLKML
jgi:hypothetical protein